MALLEEVIEAHGGREAWLRAERVRLRARSGGLLLRTRAPRGTLVVLHGHLPHASAPNRSPRPRHAYALHVIDAGASYAPDNWLQRPGLPLRGFA